MRHALRESGMSTSAIARKAVSTLAHAAHTAPLRTWPAEGVAAADQELFDLAVPLFASEDLAQRQRLELSGILAARPVSANGSAYGTNRRTVTDDRRR
jgi:hypothetical protein